MKRLASKHEVLRAYGDEFWSALDELMQGELAGTEADLAAISLAESMGLYWKRTSYDPTAVDVWTNPNIKPLPRGRRILAILLLDPPSMVPDLNDAHIFTVQRDQYDSGRWIPKMRMAHNYG